MRAPERNWKVFIPGEILKGHKTIVEEPSWKIDIYFLFSGTGKETKKSKTTARLKKTKSEKTKNSENFD